MRHLLLRFLVPPNAWVSTAVVLFVFPPLQVLAETMLNNGRLQLVVATMNGNIMLFDTDFPAAPLRAWPAEMPGRGVSTLRSGWEGIHVVEG